MKTSSRVLVQIICLLLLAAGSFLSLLAVYAVAAMVVVYFQEGKLLAGDQRWLAGAVKWLLIAAVLIGIGLLLRRKAFGNARSNVFKLVQSNVGESERIVQYTFEVLFFAWLATQLWALILAEGAIRIPIVGGWLVVAFICQHLRIAIHEIGHLTAARLLGLEPRKIQVGTGPLVWSHSFQNGLIFEWRFWSGGYVIATPKNIEGFRARQLFFVGAGPLADVALLYSSYQLIAHFFGGLPAAFEQGPAGLTASAVFYWIALQVIAGLLPHKGWVGPSQLWSDGYWLVRLLTGSRKQILELARLSNWRELLKLLDSDVSENLKAATGERELCASVVNSLAFQEQRERLKAPLLRRPSTSSLPA